MRIFSFKEENAKSNHKSGVLYCQKYLANKGIETTDVSENEKYFKIGADLVIGKLDGEYTIDVKTDEQMEKTGNIAIELIEICAFSKIKLGWAFKKFDELCYLNWYSKDIYRIPMKELKNMIFENPRKGFAALHKSPMNYFTLGILLPI